jgi:hypothetical protein
MSIPTLGTCLLLCCPVHAGAAAEAFRLEPTSEGLLLDLGPQEASDSAGVEKHPAAEEAIGGPYASQGSVSWWIEAGGGTNFNQGWVALAGIGVEWYPVDGFALGVRFDGIGVGLEETQATGGVGASILLRWHVLRREHWSLYLEGGCGLAFFSNAVPSGGAQLNFTPEVGVGVSIALHEDLRLLAGVRWYHVSNAQTASSNPGIDMVQGYIGITMPF